MASGGERENEMNKQEIYQEIEQTFGLVPSMFKEVPEPMLEHEWKLFRQIQLDEGPIPQKYRELIGLAISGVTKCRYCTFYHTEVARLFGATDEEIEAAAHYAKSSAGWSAYINGLQVDYETFCNEVRQACEHVRASQGRAEKQAVSESRPGIH
jgi:AhpD family alkylhydroperoxidase